MLSLPSTATEYSRRSRREHQAAISAIRRTWRRASPDFDESWRQLSPQIVGIVSLAQTRLAKLADDYIPAVLEETGQTRAVKASAQVNTAAFAGVTGSGVAVADQLALTPIRAKQAVSTGASSAQALAAAGAWLSGAAGTILSDTSRAVEATGMGVRPVGGYVRMLEPPSCGRCVVLAGKYYRINDGFQRHPECDCRHIPASESVAGDYRVDFHDYLISLSEEEQVKLLGSRANWRAWDEYDADPMQIINSYRWGLQTAQDASGQTIRYTEVGTTKRGLAGKRMRNATQLDRFAGSVNVDGKRKLVRRMPETILTTTQGREQIVRQLRLYGWVI